MRASPHVAQKDQGFTLIELFLVVLTIGVLVAIAIPAFLDEHEKAADSATKSDLKNAATSMETFYIDHRNYGAAGGVNGAAPQLADFRNSHGVEVTVTAVTPSGYCLDATNAASPGGLFHYNSAVGGLREGTCAAPS